MHVGIVVEEIVDQRLYKLLVLPAVSTLGCTFVSGKKFGFRSRDFVAAESESLHLLDFRQQCLERDKRFTFVAGSLSHSDFHRLAHVADAETCT